MDFFDIKQFLIENGYPVRDSGSEIQSVCLYRGGKKFNLSINKKKLKWFDFVLGRGGNIQSLVEIIQGRPIEDVDLHLTSYHEEEIEMPKIFNKNILNHLIQDHSYWENRGIDREVCISLKGGVADDLLPNKMKGRYTIPVFNQRGEIEGLTGRWLGKLNNNIPKYKHLGSKLNFLWDRNNNIQETKKAILVESPACTMSLKSCGINNSLCLFGTKISPTIINYLIGLSVNKIIISTNNEPNNENIGNRAAVKIKDKLSNYFDESMIQICLPILKDINEMLITTGKESIIKLYEKN
jgi:hypothetical protein